ncbi:MFS general substrate transporter [Gymnopilus junonius]|uniref:MFS general substrate transporter n=1 Tax=Gymnopilus junonius TaxID=109634 RepID=A0A9P5NYY1_GYMJU|nr:MFS general substrate transporter [Gymnopilus junonius]
MPQDVPPDFPPAANSSHDPFLVQFEERELANPFQWSRLRRWYISWVTGILVLNVTFSSSAPSGIIDQLTEQFHMSQKVATLTISLFVTGYCVGPILWGPLSERYGRRPIFLWAFFFYTCTQLGLALATNATTVLVLRFLAGNSVLSPLSLSLRAVISDIWEAETRGKGLSIMSASPFVGPALGPAVAGFIGVNTNWRWVFWLLTIFSAFCWVVVFLTVPETYTPVLLVYKAKRIRSDTNDTRYYAALERDPLQPLEVFSKVLSLPFKILFNEPMLIAMTIYLSFGYGCLYLLFEAYPFVFTEPHHLSPGLTGLTYLPLAVGGIFAIILYAVIFNPRYGKEVKKCAPDPVPPEFRLEIAFIAAPIFAISFFWFAWTSFPSISLWVPLMAGVPLGFSMCWIFLSMYNYIVDVYLSVAASAVAACTVCRSMAAAAFPLFAGNMYDKLGPQWASSILGFFAVVLIPIPFLLIRYGPVLRRKSKFVPRVLPPSNITDKV